MIELRPYQRESIEAVYAYWREGGGNPLIEMATGLGKSVVVAEINRQILTRWPDMRVLNLVHVRELVAQNYSAVRRLWPDVPAGIYSAGLGRRDAHSRIVFASIQSVYKKAEVLGARDLVLIDEAHLVPHHSEGMYQTLLASLRRMRSDLRVLGLTATPYRLDSGRLDMGEGRLFDGIVYSYDVASGIADGWLSPIKARLAAAQIDVSQVARRGGEFVAGDLEKAANTDDLVEAACDEIMAHGQSRRSWLVFCSGVQHAEHVALALQRRGIAAAMICGETPTGERDRLISAFKAGTIRALTNANVLTTGFDAPAVDLIALLRPTLSAGLYVQMIGRGTRKAEGKAECLVLDFAGNARRHGPIDAIEGRRPSEKNKNDEEHKVKVDEVRGKECPSCLFIVPFAAAECIHCGFEFPKPPPKHEAKPDAAAVLFKAELPPPQVQEAPVLSWVARLHEKMGSPDSVRITYRAGMMQYDEWICPEHEGFARQKFAKWWVEHGGHEPPRSVQETLDRFGELSRPEAIFVKPDGKWWRIAGRRLPRPSEVIAIIKETA